MHWLIRLLPRNKQLVIFRELGDSVPRWGYGYAPHTGMAKVIDTWRASYSNRIQEFIKVRDKIALIEFEGANAGEQEPFWNNSYFSGLDAVSLYGMLATLNPKQYVEVGSGNSTKFARRAIRDNDLKTQITSIDPTPRASIDNLCDKVFRQTLQEIDQSLFESLNAGDILFIDGSHRVSMSSDVTVFFTELLPKLKPGVIIHLHDIFLPSDYPSRWRDRYYGEQYLLGTILLINPNYLNIIFPVQYISTDPQLSLLLEPLWNMPSMKGVSRGGGSFWFEKNNEHHEAITNNLDDDATGSNSIK